MSQSHPWQFRPTESLTDDDVRELNELCGNLQSNDCDGMSSSLARHFVHEDSGERGIGKDQPVDPIEAYNRSMKVCG